MSGKIEASKRWDLHCFSVGIIASLDYGNNIHKSFGFMKSNVQNNCAADGEESRRWNTEILVDFAVVFIILKIIYKNSSFFKDLSPFLLKWDLKRF